MVFKDRSVAFALKFILMAILLTLLLLHARVASGAGDAAIAWARVEARTPGGRVFAYASVIDNATGDPTIVPVIVP